MNVDDCIVVGRDSTGQLIADPQAFPAGVLPYAQSLNALGFRAGFYSDRGNYTCSCWAGGLKRPGSRGHELQDASTWASWGLEEIKVDSCNDNGENNTGEDHHHCCNGCGVPAVQSSLLSSSMQAPLTSMLSSGMVSTRQGSTSCTTCAGVRAQQWLL